MNKSSSFTNNALSIIQGHTNTNNYNTNFTQKPTYQTHDSSLLKSVDKIFFSNNNDKNKELKITCELQKLVNEHELNKNKPFKTFKEIADSITRNFRKNDDKRFADKEIQMINQKLEKSKQKNLKIWDKKTTYITEETKDVNIRKKIFEIKKLVKEKEGLSVDIIDIKGRKMLNREDLDVIYESSKIIKEQALNANQKDNIPGKISSIHEYIYDNREITMKNYLLDLLRNERLKINTKEGEVTKALKDSEYKLEDDYKKFEIFTEYERNKQKEMEKNLLEAGKDNRELADKKKKLNQENKLIMDELERTVKAIRSYKGDAIFVHHVLNDLNSIKFKNDIDVITVKNFDYNDIPLQKDSDLERIIDDLM